MPGVERLQQIGGFPAPDFADDDMIGPVPEGVFDQVPDRDASGQGRSEQCLGHRSPRFWCR